MSTYFYACRVCKRWFKSDNIRASAVRCPHCGGHAK